MSDVNADPVIEKVAEALCNTATKDYDAWSIVYGTDREYWLELAAAAIEALGLEPDWALATGAGRVYYMSEQSATEKAERWPESFHAQHRLVGPWVRVGSDV